MKNPKKLSKNLLSVFLEVNTSLPAKNLIDENDVITEKLGEIIVTLDMAQDLIGNAGYRPDCSQISNVTEEERLKIKDLIEIISKKGICTDDDFAFIKRLKSTTCSKSCLLPYMYREFYWIITSIACASYISSLILLRSIVELLINITTTQDGGTYKKINGISFFDSEEKKDIKQTWDVLCSWSHPYNKWIKNICSKYVAHYPILFHPSIAEDCINLAYRVLDIYLVVAKEYFKMDTSLFYENKGPIRISKFPLFKKRINKDISNYQLTKTHNK